MKVFYPLSRHPSCLALQLPYFTSLLGWEPGLLKVFNREMGQEVARMWPCPGRLLIKKQEPGGRGPYRWAEGGQHAPGQVLSPSNRSLNIQGSRGLVTPTSEGAQVSRPLSEVGRLRSVERNISKMCPEEGEQPCQAHISRDLMESSLLPWRSL